MLVPSYLFFAFVAPVQVVTIKPDVRILSTFFEPLVFVYTAPFILVATVPIFTTWLWFPQEVRRFSDQLKCQQDKSKFVPIDIKKRRNVHYLAATSITLVGMIPFSLGLGNDRLLDWFEQAGIAGWTLLFLLIGVQTILCVLTLIRILEFLIWFLGRLREPIRIRPLHPDECGGLGFIGDTFGKLALFATTMGFFMVWGMFVTIRWNNQNAGLGELAIGLILNIVLLVSAYFVLVGAFLFLPTLSTRKAMVRERGLKLREVSDEYERKIVESTLSYDQKTSVMQQYGQQHAFVRSTYPTLPFPIKRWWGLQILSALPPLISFQGLFFQFLQIK